MKKLLLISALLAFMVAQANAAPAASYSFLKDRGARVYVDTLRWSNNHGLGTGGLQDTLIGNADSDTTTEIDLANLEAFSAYITAQGHGGTNAVTCSLDVSLDGKNWVRPVGSPVWSANATLAWSSGIRVYYASEADTALGSTDVGGPRTKAIIQGSRVARFRCVQAVQANTDTTVLYIIAYRSYKPFNP
jgi:hypothetical protein